LKKEINLYIPDVIINKIKYICSNISREEWSGILFYDTKGSIKKPDSLKLIVKDFLPMDKGTKTFTSYELDHRFTDYLMENPEAMGWKVGHIHSHNSMSVYFSGTDDSELQDNADKYDYYLSLIVNNYLEMTAKVVTIATAKVETILASYLAQDENGNTYEVKPGKFFIDDTKIFEYECKIHNSLQKFIIDDKFASHVSDIIKPKPVIVTESKTVIYNGKNKDHLIDDWSNHNNWINHNKLSKNVSTGPSMVLANQISNYASFYTMSNFKEFTDIELFIIGLFNFKGYAEKSDSPEMMFSLVLNFDMEDHEIVSSVINSYIDMYAGFFPDRDMEECINDMCEVIDICEQYVTVFPYLDAVVIALKNLNENLTTTENYENRRTIQSV